MSATTSKPKMTRTHSTPSDNVDKDFIITPVTVHARAGSTVEIEIRLENKSDRKAEQFEVRVDSKYLPIRGATISMPDNICYALEGI